MLLALAVGGCFGGGDDAEQASRPIPGRTLTIYSSLPRRGDSAAAAAAVAAGERRALADAGGRVSRYRVRLVELDSTGAGDRVWNPALVNANAKRAAADRTTIAYLGELQYGGSAVSLPITNDKGILQVAPADGLTSLTVSPPGDPRAGPERYYPAGRRTFVRLVPNDLRVAGALLGLVERAGAHRVAVVEDDRIAGEELTRVLARRAPHYGLEVVDTKDAPRDATGAAGLARDLVERRPDALVWAGVADGNTAALAAAAERALPGLRVWGTAGLAAAPAPAGAATATVVSPFRPARGYPASAARLLRRLGSRAGGRVEALYGYESVRLVLDAVRAGGPSRAAVVRTALAERPRRSVLGPYRVERTGDVSERALAVYRAAGGRLRLERLVP